MRARDKLRAEDHKHLMAQPQFRRLLFEIYTASGILRVSREEQQRLFHEGKRSLGLDILGWFSATPSEPNDVIATIIEAENDITQQGASHDYRDYPYE